ncbi:MAG TPA: indole-3-glycerol phosphate synthase TrpC [Cyclobacteriaceae bacterium]|nr:indole-3-glycerol phosphate synthase TrpC [Cyclobacteriaceae bacterium]HMV09346.1 indole-3-glycerol phosphate synthase TrpC [Cyclobacteriaceae bacterium]HMV91656.1 indole-3-glycerol phosphate synthase TrpC [Cyclobacteriaceae bacterium]HMX01005.1 indole-3-glycerol phosphate synthase TrpC [Cyclobacteriaceae bacterium]HMX51145.1 indole-3-glycerol phosphate synthase TrpC [Cyclobacteriaceae bacterium]
MTILDTIVAHKKKEVAVRLESAPLSLLEKRPLFRQPVISLKKRLLEKDASGIIAEFKRQSPSKGVINSTALPDATTLQYIQAGASGLSVLTDNHFFGGSEEDFLSARRANGNAPMVRKDFVVNEYQIVEARSVGADVILLIAACLDPAEILAFSKLAHSLGMEVLLEVHNEEELLQNLRSEADLIGVNNRNLKTFEVDINLSKKLFPLIPKDAVKVSESGIENVETIRELREIGFGGFLMGQRFMEQPNPGQACQAFIETLRKTK